MVDSRQDGQRLLSPGLLVVSLQTPGQYPFSPPLSWSFFSHRNTMEKCQPHPSAGVQCTFHRCSGLIVLQFTIDTRIRYQHKVSKYEAEKDQTGHYSHIFVFLISCENCFLIVQCEDETKKNRNFVKWRMKGNEEIGSIRTHSLNTRRNANRQLG